MTPTRKLSVVSLADPGGQRAVLDSTCERVYATQQDGVCLTADRGIVTTYGITELDANLSPTTSSQLTGSPSRARISKDGSLISTTTFVTGHAYSETSFSTDTVIRRANGEVIGSIEGLHHHSRRPTAHRSRSELLGCHLRRRRHLLRHRGLEHRRQDLARQGQHFRAHDDVGPDGRRMPEYLS